MEIKDIIPTAHNIVGAVKPMPVNAKGIAKYEKAEMFTGSFNYELQDMKIMLELMSNGLETETHVVIPNGFIAGHKSEYSGQILMLTKRQSKSECKLYCKETIQLEGTGCGTIAVMEWIESHGCPDLDTVFFNEGQRDVLTVSNMKDDELFIERDNQGMIDWYEVPVNGKTALRYHEDFWWVFKINGKYYFATI